jgi:hypothetical protein
MKKIISFVIAAIFSFSLMGFAGHDVFASEETAAHEKEKGQAAIGITDGGCSKPFLGLRPWYQGVIEKVGDNCVVKAPESSDGSEIAKFVWKIALNIIADVSLMVGYVTIGFFVYGGYKYIMSNGDPSNVVKAKSTITNAVIGLIIAILSTVIVNTIFVVINGATK